MSTAITLTLLAAVTALDEPSDPEPNEIVVTGERIPRTLRDTASSVDVTTADRIESLSGADRIEQILEQTPNVVLGNGGPTIRGQDTTGVLQALPAFLGGTRPRTTLQVDGRAVSFNEFVNGTAGLWDIEKVEVFRTPQTTTQGRNSIAGAIFIQSKDPTYEWEGRTRALAGNYRARQTSAVLSGPIIHDQLAFRAVGDLRRGRPSSEIVDVTRGADPNNDDYSLLRFKLLGEPRSWPGSRIEVTYAHSETYAPSLDGIRPPFRERRDPFDGYGTFKTNVDSLTTIVETLLTAELGATTTLSYGDANIRRFNIPGLGETKNHVRDFSVETVIDWNPNGPTRIVGGVSHWRASLDQFIDLTRATGIGLFDDEQRSIGFFGDVTLQPLARTTVTVGLRYQRDRQQRSGAMGTPTNEIPLDFDGSFSAWLPKLSVSYDVTDELRTGVLIQRAYNPGGTTLRLDTGQSENFDAETLWNCELFVRGRFAGGALTVAGNFFSTSIRDTQRFRTYFVGRLGLAEIFNVPKARTYGAELTAEWQASDRLSARATVGLLDTRISETDAESDFLRGSEFQRSPGLTASGAIDWRPMDALRLSAQVRHHSSYFSDDEETELLRIGPATFVDARASWTVGRVSLFGYVRNLLDTFRLQFLFDRSKPEEPTDLATAHDPRELGIGLEARF